MGVIEDAGIQLNADGSLHTVIGEESYRHTFDASHAERKQYERASASPSSDLHKSKNTIVGMFSNSSEDLSQKMMFKSGMSLAHNQRQKMLDEAHATYNTGLETLRSDTTDKNLSANNRDRSQDVIAIEYQDKKMFDKPIIVLKKPSQTLLRVRLPEETVAGAPSQSFAMN